MTDLAELRREVALQEPVLSQEQIDSYRLTIRTAWQKSIVSIVDTGRVIVRIRDAVPHGQFGRLFEGPHAPFKYGTARALMTIAEHEVLSNVQHATVLPASWYSLFLLSAFPAQRLEQLIANKTVHAELQRRDIDAIINRERSRNRRADTFPDEELQLPSLEPSHSPASGGDPDWVTVGDTLRELRKLVVDMRDLQDVIRRDPSDMKHFRTIADDILSIVEGDPVPEEDEQS